MTLNPLVVPEIFVNVFKYLELSDLLKSRLVCRVWDSETSIFISRRKIICINNEIALEEFYQVVSKNENQPFRTFELWSFPIDLDKEQTLKYISTCGPYMHHVTLNFDKESGFQIQLRTLRDLLLYYLPNLKSLSIRQLPLQITSQKWIFPPQGDSKFRQPLLLSLKSLTIYSDADYNEHFLKNLISSTKNLEEIIVEYGDEPRDFKKYFLSAIFACSSQLKNLRSFQYFMHDPGSGPQWAWNMEECTKLAELNLKLNSIKLHPGGIGQTRCVYVLLEKVAKSLEYLKLRVHDQLNCPKMERLTSIILYDYEGTLSFLSQLPNLLHFGLCEYSPAKFLTPENIISKKSHSIISLNFYGSYSISTHLFESIASALPNLRILNFWHMNNEKLKIVIEKFPFLEELTINVVDVDDEIFAGFPLDLCEQMERLWNFTEYTQTQHQSERSRTGPFIGQLKNLRRLEMHGACLAEWKWSSMSDVSVHLGLVHLSNLTSLSLYEFKWITDSAIRSVCESLPLLYLKLDSRVFSENLLTDLKLMRPEMRLEYVTDEFESYSTFSFHAH